MNSLKSDKLAAARITEWLMWTAERSREIQWDNVRALSGGLTSACTAAAEEALLPRERTCRSPACKGPQKTGH